MLLIVARVVCDFKAVSRYHEMTVAFYELQQLEPKSPPNPQLWAGKHVAVLLEDRSRDVQLRRFCNGKQQHGARQSGWLDRGGNQHIRIYHQTQGEHYRFRF